MNQIASPRETKEWVTFRLGAQRFALPVAHVREVARGQAVTAVPRAGEAVAGITKLRRGITPVIDLHRQLDIPHTGAPSPVLIVVDHGEDAVALQVEKLDGLITPMHEPSPPPVTMDEKWRRITAGLVQHEGALYALLDTEALLRDAA